MKNTELNGTLPQEKIQAYQVKAYNVVGYQLDKEDIKPYDVKSYKVTSYTNEELDMLANGQSVKTCEEMQD